MSTMLCVCIIPKPQYIQYAVCLFNSQCKLKYVQNAVCCVISNANPNIKYVVCLCNSQSKPKYVQSTFHLHQHVISNPPPPKFIDCS